MSRIATLATVLTMAVAPAAFAGPADYGSPNAPTAVQRAVPSNIDLRSPDAVTGFTAPAAHVDLRSPDAVTGFTAPAARVDLRSPDAVNGFVSPSPASQPSAADNGSDISVWAILAIVAGALGACALLAVMLRRHFQVGRPVGV
jgi:hypothetical protein